MAFRRLEQVRVGNNPPGQIFGGYIYQLGVEIGHSGQPTRVSCQVVNEKGNYTINPDKDLSAISPMPIYIGEGSTKSSVVMPTMYLVSYNINQTAGGLTLSLEFLDRTIWLNKIWVGLIGKGTGPHNLVKPDKVRYAQNHPMSVKLPIQCAPCSVGDPKFKGIEVVNVPYLSSHGFASNIDQQKGGAILIGTEEFSNSQCDNKNISYNWQELLAVMNVNGIQVQPDSFGNPQIHDRGKVHYRRQHANQSLSKVLSKWAEEFGFQWAWNPFTNMIYGRDLQKGVLDLAPVREAVESFGFPFDADGKFKSGHGVVITDYNQSYDLKNTHRQDHISFYQKPKKVRNNGFVAYKRTIAKNIQVEDIIPAVALGLKRTYDEFKISAALSKYNKSARKLYLWSLVEKKFAAGAQQAQGGELEPLGITQAYKFTTEEKQKFAAAGLGRGLVGDSKDEETFLDSYGDDVDLYLAVYSEELDNHWEDWESKWADFIGKYYMVEKDVRDFDYCDALRNRSVSVTNHPLSSEEYSHSSILDMPFGDLIKTSPCHSVAGGCTSLAAAGEFGLKWICWGANIAEKEATAGRKDLSSAAHYNNSCCAYVHGVVNGSKLIRGRTYYFDQSDKSWLSTEPAAKNPPNTQGKPQNYAKCGSIFDRGGSFAGDVCRRINGPRYFLVNEDGSTADGYEYHGTPGIDGRGTYTVPKKGPIGQRVYLKQEGDYWKTYGCSVKGADSPLNVRDRYPERFLDIVEDLTPDAGPKVFIFERANKWGQTEEEVNNVLLDSTKADFLSKWVPKVREINELSMQLFGDQFEQIFGKDIFNHYSTLSSRQQRVHLIWVPKQTIVKKHFTVSNIGAAVNFNESTFLKQDEEQKRKKCTDICGLTFLEMYCRCLEGITFPAKPRANGLVSNTCGAFQVSIKNREPITKEDGTVMRTELGTMLKTTVSTSRYIKFPSIHSYLGYNTYAVTDLNVVKSINQTFGNIGNAGGAMNFTVNLTDITADIDNFNVDPNERASNESQSNEKERGAGSGLAGQAGSGRIIEAPMILPPTAYGAGNKISTYTTAGAYHFQLLGGGNVINNETAGEKVEFTIVGWDWDGISSIFGPDHGMDGFSISYGSKGIQTKFSYSTKFAKPPDLGQLWPEIHSQINLNAFGRTF